MYDRNDKINMAFMEQNSKDALNKVKEKTSLKILKTVLFCFW